MALSGIRLPVVNQDSVTTYREQYSKNFIIKAGEMETKLLSTVTIESMDPGAEYILVDAVEQLASAHSNLPTAATQRFGSTSYSYTRFAKRQIDSNLFQRFEPIRSGDLKSISNPQNKIIQMTIGAYNRKMDADIVAGAVGTAIEKHYDTSGVKQTSSKTFSDSQIIPDSQSEGFTWERFLQVEKMFRDNGINVDVETVFLIIGNHQLAEAKEDDRFINSLYTGEYVLRNGAKLPIVNNMVLIPSNELTLTNNVRDCLAWTKDGVTVALEEDWEVTLELATELNHNYSLGMKKGYGVTRMDEKRVLKFQCSESATSGITT